MADVERAHDDESIGGMNAPHIRDAPPKEGETHRFEVRTCFGWHGRGRCWMGRGWIAAGVAVVKQPYFWVHSVCLRVAYRHLK